MVNICYFWPFICILGLKSDAFNPTYFARWVGTTFRRDKTRNFRDKTRQNLRQSRAKDASQDKTRLLSPLENDFETRQDFQNFQNLGTRRDETAFPVSSRPGIRDGKFPDPSLKHITIRVRLRI